MVLVILSWLLCLVAYLLNFIHFLSSCVPTSLGIICGFVVVVGAFVAVGPLCSVVPKLYRWGVVVPGGGGGACCLDVVIEVHVLAFLLLDYSCLAFLLLHEC